ncbi:MAG: hypothetical protein IJJ65_08700 [Butyrivibrio sp.]|nr:hypothetical protein [Butyrivibrio sp.]
MKTVVLRLPAGDWGVKCRLKDGSWALWSSACKNKQEAVTQARYSAICMPSGRLYGT